MRDCVQFWHRQMTEHALFLELLLEDPALRSRAAELHRLWERTPAFRETVRGPLNELVEFKQQVLTRQKSGEWVGWALPSFVQHILYEARYFQLRLRGPDAPEDAPAWIKIVQDHALVGPKLVDPGAAPPTDSVAAELGRLMQQCSVPGHTCLAEADAEMEKVSAWVRAVPPGSTIIPPILSAHILRENARGQKAVRELAGGSVSGGLRWNVP